MLTPLKFDSFSMTRLSGALFDLGLPALDRENLAEMAIVRRAVKGGETLFRQGEPLVALYEVHAGCFKTTVTLEDGRDQIAGFQIVGDFLGLDSIGSDQHTVEAVALEAAQVWVVPFSNLETMCARSADFQHAFHKIMGREISASREMMILLGSMRAEARLAAFLLDLTGRMQARGFSASAVNLRMSRQEIGSYLGLKIETVSRLFSKLHQNGTLSVRQRDVRVRDHVALRKIASAVASE